jgi:hypothetical protein
MESRDVEPVSPPESVDTRTQAFLQRTSNRLMRNLALNMTLLPALTTAIVAPLQHIIVGLPTGQSLLMGVAEGVTLGVMATARDIRTIGKGK